MDGVSVIICTFNGADRLPACLSALGACARDAHAEVIIVDNNSTDGSAQVAQETWDRLNPTEFPMRVASEPRQGLSYARIAGTKSAHHDLILFCDDDNILATDYLVIARQLMGDPSVGAAGGSSDPISTVPLPDWFYTYSSYYAVGHQAQGLEAIEKEYVDVTLTGRQFLWGAGLVTRRVDLLKIFACPDFPLLSDRCGTALSTGGDEEICHLIGLMRKRLLFSPQLRLSHAIPARRLTQCYLRDLLEGVDARTETDLAYRTVRTLVERNRVPTVIKIIVRMFENAVRLRKPKTELFFLSALLGVTRWMDTTQRGVYRNYKWICSSED